MRDEILDDLKKALLEYNGDAVANCAKKAVMEGIDPIKAFESLTDAIRQVGEAFGKGEIWLPELIGAADAMKRAVPILEDEIVKTGRVRKQLGVVVIGTMYGDIHDMGKPLVSTMHTAEGFEVHDLGANVVAGKFVEEIKEHQADILALSALLTTTAAEQRRVIEMLKKEGIREKVEIIVGGGAIAEIFTQDFGTDAYDPAAPGAVKLARKLLGKLPVRSLRCQGLTHRPPQEENRECPSVPKRTCSG